MNRLHIIGRKNSGKTTLVVDLVREFTRRGLRVGTIKHTHHQHELDTPGKDSHHHRQAGAAVVGILSRSMNAVFWPPEESGRRPRDARYDAFAPMFAGCELVLVEGDSQACGCKVEVWRAALEAMPIAADDPSVAAVITDDDLRIGAPVWPRSDINRVASEILSLIQNRPAEPRRSDSRHLERLAPDRVDETGGGWCHRPATAERSCLYDSGTD